MELKSDDLRKFKKYLVGGDTFNNGGIIYKYSDDILYKIVYEYVFCDEIERNVDLQIREHILNTPFIYDKIYIDGYFSGYSMEYLRDCFTFRRAVYLSVDFDSCVKVIHDVYDVIRYLHDRDILIGDINMDNFLISNKGDGYVIDLDYMVFSGDEYKFDDLYYVKLNNDSDKICIDDKRTDNIKAMICGLSIIFGIDLEKRFIINSIIDMENVYNEYVKNLNIECLNRYFRCIMNGEDIDYFDEFLFKNYNSFFNNCGIKIKSLHNKK